MHKHYGQNKTSQTDFETKSTTPNLKINYLQLEIEDVKTFFRSSRQRYVRIYEWIFGNYKIADIIKG
jgi:hypothetical protein